MDWFWRLFFDVVLRLSWVEQLAALARLNVEAIIFFHQRHPPGTLSPWLERSLACWSDRMLARTHTLIEAYIFHRAMDLIGVYPWKHRRFVYHDVAEQALSRRQVGWRLRQLCRRLETLEQTARKRARLYRRWREEASSPAPSARVPGGARRPAAPTTRAQPAAVSPVKTTRRSFAIRDGPVGTL